MSAGIGSSPGAKPVREAAVLDAGAETSDIWECPGRPFPSGPLE